MKCTHCGKIIEDGSDFCYYCGTVFNDEKMSKVIVEEMGAEQPQRRSKEDDRSASKPYPQKQIADSQPKSKESSSGVGKAIEVVSVIIMIIGFISSIVFMCMVSVPVGLGTMIGSLLFGLMSFGFGRIICLLTSINAKLK